MPVLYSNKVIANCGPVKNPYANDTQVYTSVLVSDASVLMQWFAVCIKQ